jgi:hypothetical protein
MQRKIKKTQTIWRMAYFHMCLMSLFLKIIMISCREDCGEAPAEQELQVTFNWPYGCGKLSGLSKRPEDREEQRPVHFHLTPLS